MQRTSRTISFAMPVALAVLLGAAGQSVWAAQPSASPSQGIATAAGAACTGSMKTRIMTAVGLVLAIGGMSMAPAFGEDNGNGYGNGNHEGQEKHGANNNYQHNQGHQSEHGNRQAYQHPNNDHRRGDYYGNQDYVYAPPPVVYAPESAPGISLFIPLQFR